MIVFVPFCMNQAQSAINLYCLSIYTVKIPGCMSNCSEFLVHSSFILLDTGTVKLPVQVVQIVPVL